MGHDDSQPISQLPTIPPGSAHSIPLALAASAEYEVIREINRGAMGVVYLVRNRRMDRLEGLKVIQQTLLEQTSAAERFEREMRSAARLNHPNIVTAYSSPPLPGLLAFAMEYVDGEDLYNLVKTHGRLPVSNACCYIHQVAQGLQHAHERHLVHRDIKPNNLILMHDGDRHIVKILDFGLAKATSENQPEGGLTGTGQMMGTPHYMAPEQIMNAAKADIRADIYSLGCTLYYLLTGAPPFEGKSSLYEILTAHNVETPRPVNEVRPDVPTDLAAIVARMTAKDPVKRFQTPADVARALAVYFQEGIEQVPAARAFIPQAAAPKSDASQSAKDTQVDEPSAAPLAPPPTLELSAVSVPDRGTAVPQWNNQWDKSSVASEHGRHSSAGRSKSGQRDTNRQDRHWPLAAHLGIAAAILVAGLLTVWAIGVFNNENMKETSATTLAPKTGPQKNGAPIVSNNLNEPDGTAAVEKKRADQHSIERRTDDDKIQHPSIAAKSDVPAARAQGGTEVPSPSSSRTSSGRADAQIAGDQRDDNGLEMKLVWCPPGTFAMENAKSENDSADSKNQIAVTLSQGFWLGMYEVTQGEYVRIRHQNPSRFSAQGESQQAVAGYDTDRFPVERVSWDEAVEYCRKLTDQERLAGRLPTGWEYTLPTEAQWEYACRAATTTAYSFGDLLNGSLANCNGNFPYGTDAQGPFLERPATVGSYKANAWGLCDMHGNVWEWCRDWHAAKLPGGTDPFVATGDPATGESERVIRGGSWFSDARDCRTAYRLAASPGFRGHGLGFRVALVPSKSM